MRHVGIWLANVSNSVQNIHGNAGFLGTARIIDFTERTFFTNPCRIDGAEGFSPDSRMQILLV